MHRLVTGPTCQVTEEADRVTILTTPKRAEAVLLVLSGATLAEAGAVVGVSRERVRQYLLDAHVNTHQRQRFTGRPQRYARARLLSEQRPTRAERRALLRLRLTSVVGYIVAFQRLNGRAPTYSELWWMVSGLLYRWGAFSYAANALNAYLGRQHLERRSSRRLWLAYRLAGAKPYPRFGRPLREGDGAVTVPSPHTRNA